jgi:hypothetical protein
MHIFYLPTFGRESNQKIYQQVYIKIKTTTSTAYAVKINSTNDNSLREAHNFFEMHPFIYKGTTNTAIMGEKKTIKTS